MSKNRMSVEEYRRMIEPKRSSQATVVVAPDKSTKKKQPKRLKKEPKDWPRLGEYDDNFYGRAVSPVVKVAMDPVELPPPPDLAERMRAMGAFFELDPKRVEFYIRQLQLSKRIP